MSVAAPHLPEKLGKYHVRREVGRGGMGVVYEGFDPIIERRVALKTFITEFYDGTQADNLLTRLRREAQAAGRLSHPNIIAVYEFGEESANDAAGTAHTAFIAMEFVEGRSLESYFEANERFRIQDVIRILSELLDALAYSHEHGVIHRDIKPANIILLKNGTVKVADFGVARIESSTLTQVGTVLGSPSYMSPEQFMGQTVDGRSDLYSAGVVLYQLLTGEVAFTGAFTTIMHRVLHDTAPPPSALNVMVPRGFDALLARAMAKRPDERFQSAAQFKQALLSATASQEGATPAVASSEHGTLIRAGATAAPGAVAAPTPPASAKTPPGSGALTPRALFAILAMVFVILAAAATYWWNPRFHAGRPSETAAAPRSTPMTGPSATPSATPTAIATPAATPGSGILITAVGVSDPADTAMAREPGAAERAVTEDARRQAVAKAVALYVEPASLEANYGLIRTKLLSRSGDFITSVVAQTEPQVAEDGRLVGTLRVGVNVREVERALNEISREERVDFIRNNGDPRIAVNVNVSDMDTPAGAMVPSAVAGNLLKERIRSFGFTVVDSDTANPPPDFKVNGEVHFKRLAARLPASGITIEKFVLTSWTINALDIQSGQEIYHNTAIPQKQSWATEELALQEIGQALGAQFTKNFFLQYFDFKPKTVRMSFTGVPPAAAAAVLLAVNSSLVVLNATAGSASGTDLVIDADLSAGAAPADASVRHGILEPLNRKLGRDCFSIGAVDAAELRIAFAASCRLEAIMKQLGAPADLPAVPAATPGGASAPPGEDARKIKT